jgi:hypothetical protein
MKRGYFCIILFLLLFLIPGCQYRKGKAFTWTETGDSIQYLIADAGRGKHITNKIAQLVEMHERKGDSCQVFYLGDSNAIRNDRSLILFNSVLPDLKEDMLSKGFLGTFTTRQIITYLVVRREDFDKYLTAKH